MTNGQGILKIDSNLETFINKSQYDILMLKINFTHSLYINIIKFLAYMPYDLRIIFLFKIKYAVK